MRFEFEFQAQWTKLWNEHWQEVYDQQFKIFVDSKLQENLEIVSENVSCNLPESESNKFEEMTKPPTSDDICDNLENLVIEDGNEKLENVLNPESNSKTNEKEQTNIGDEKVEECPKHSISISSKNSENENRKNLSNWKSSARLQGVGPFLQILAKSNDAVVDASESANAVHTLVDAIVHAAVDATESKTTADG